MLEPEAHSVGMKGADGCAVLGTSWDELELSRTIGITSHMAVSSHSPALPHESEHPPGPAVREDCRRSLEKKGQGQPHQLRLAYE